MLLLGVLIMAAGPLLLGWCLLSLVPAASGRYFLGEKIALCFALGLGFLVLAMFALACAGLPLDLRTIGVTVIVVCGLAGLALRLKKLPFFIGRQELFHAQLIPLKLQLPELLVLIFLALKFIYAFFIAVVKPLVDIDAFQCYSIAARYLYFGRNLFAPELQAFLGDKPPFVALAQAWGFISLQSPNDAWFKVLTPLLFGCFLVIFYSALRRWHGRKPSLLFTALLASLPFLVHHVTTAYADFPATFYYGAGTIYLYLFYKEAQAGKKSPAASHLYLGVLLLALAVWVKRSGLVLAAIDLSVLGYFWWSLRARFNFKQLAAALALFLLLVSPWLVQGRLGALDRTVKALTGQAVPTTLSGEQAKSLSASPEKLPVILATFGRKLFLYGDWNLAWGLLVVTLLWLRQRSWQRPLGFLLAAILLVTLSYMVQFEGETFLWLLDGTLLDRLVMNIVPVVLFFCAEAAIPYLKGSFWADANRV